MRGLHGAQGKPRESGATHIGRVRGRPLEEVLLKLNLQNEQGLERSEEKQQSVPKYKRMKFL